VWNFTLHYTWCDWVCLLSQVLDHYENPRNIGSMDKSDKNVGTGLVGAPACGDVMKLQVRTYVHRYYITVSMVYIWKSASSQDSVGM
jgi:hypothetical protein